MAGRACLRLAKPCATLCIGSSLQGDSRWFQLRTRHCTRPGQVPLGMALLRLGTGDRPLCDGPPPSLGATCEPFSFVHTPRSDDPKRSESPAGPRSTTNRADAQTNSSRCDGPYPAGYIMRQNRCYCVWLSGQSRTQRECIRTRDQRLVSDKALTRGAPFFTWGREEVLRLLRACSEFQVSPDDPNYTYYREVLLKGAADNRVPLYSMLTCGSPSSATSSIIPPHRHFPLNKSKTKAPIPRHLCPNRKKK